MSCDRERITDLTRGFEVAYNTGEPDLLRAIVVRGGMSFSIHGGAVPVLARDPDAFVEVAGERHAQGERLKITSIYVAAEGPAVYLAVTADRTAPDLPGGSERIWGNAAISCEQGRFIHLNLAVRSR